MTAFDEVGKHPLNEIFRVAVGRADTKRLVILPLKLATSRSWGAYAFLFEQLQGEAA